MTIFSTSAPVRISAPKRWAGFGESLRQLTDAAADKACRAESAVRFAELVVEEIESRSLLARANERSENAACCQGGFEQIVFKPLVQPIGDAHRQDAQEFVHLFFAEAVKLPTDFQKLGGIETSRIGFIG